MLDDNYQAIEDFIAIINDISELERLGFVFNIDGDELVIIPKSLEVTYSVLEKLNSYRGLFLKKNYYPEHIIIQSIKYKKILGDNYAC